MSVLEKTHQSELRQTETVGSESTDSQIQYRGRKTSRAGSEQRRRAILEAALRIVVKDGVRAIRHRNVAKEADVPLAATTYYFKDIQELISDTFMLYAEKAQTIVNVFARKMYEPLENADGKKLAELTTGPKLVEVIVEQLMAYVMEKTTHSRDMAVADQAFRYEALLNDNLRGLASQHAKALEDKLIEFLNLVHSSHPKEDAQILISTLRRVEYECLLVEPEDIDKVALRQMLERQVSLILKIDVPTE
ncbi:TetR family transcriptional regulator [Bermanella marisrubri]|uniref:Probable transcriptional regulator n=1 Tax=Bermanella marisrubri TaxID=207949 RepID=Q1N345_9GAMM|nr:TetR family transcriptional regulator [Bermanella marisrubri]EAT12746.1 probable transcriptional regulator [Oceanobacter sp. RED65] [Bermanella marisrubri]QIZ85137.1 TetR family transcriptional regulator [Bermanella marisrubri]